MIRSKLFIKKAIVAATLSAALVSGNIAFNLPASTVMAEADIIDDLDVDETQDLSGEDAQDGTTPTENVDTPAADSATPGGQDEGTSSDDVIPEDENADTNIPAAGTDTTGTDTTASSETTAITGDETTTGESGTPQEGETSVDDDNASDEVGQATAIKNEPAETPDENADSTENNVPADEVTDPASEEGTNEGSGDKPKLILKSKSLAKVYDGKALENGNEPLEVEEGWLGSDGADYKFTASITTGHAFNTFEILPWEGTDLDKYEIELGYGDLNVIERDGDLKYILTVTGVSGETKYNGSEQTLSGFVVDGRSYSEFRIEASGDPNETIGFTIGEAEFTVSGISASVTARDAGTHFVDISGAPVVRDSSGADVTDEFQFEYFAGKFTINPREVTLKSASDKKEYDGKALKNHEVTVSGDGFVEGEGVTYKFTGQQKDVGESFNYFTYVMNEGTLESNYDITVVPGKLKVKESDKSQENENNNNNNNNTGSDDPGENTGSDSGESASSAPESDKAEVRPVGDQNGEVLGARRAGEIVEAALGARNSATDDMSVDWYGRVLVMAACFILTTIIWGKKRKENE